MYIERRLTREEARLFSLMSEELRLYFNFGGLMSKFRVGMSNLGLKISGVGETSALKFARLSAAEKGLFNKGNDVFVAKSTRSANAPVLGLITKPVNTAVLKLTASNITNNAASTMGPTIPQLPLPVPVFEHRGTKSSMAQTIMNRFNLDKRYELINNGKGIRDVVTGNRIKNREGLNELGNRLALTSGLKIPENIGLTVTNSAPNKLLGINFRRNIDPFAGSSSGRTMYNGGGGPRRGRFGSRFTEIEKEEIDQQKLFSDFYMWYYNL